MREIVVFATGMGMSFSERIISRLGEPEMPSPVSFTCRDPMTTLFRKPQVQKDMVIVARGGARTLNLKISG